MNNIYFLFSESYNLIKAMLEAQKQQQCKEILHE